jgi:membrane-bound lytic murein transglycosylase B
MSVLVSLAFSEPQNQEFRSQIFAALTALDKDASHQADFRSDWAGKLGMLNFSVLNYLTSGQDFDQDAFADIWQSNADAFASVAKFLADKGWNKEQTWGRQVKLPTKFDSKYLGFAQAKTLTQWQQLGVRRFNGKSLPRAKIKAALIAPDGVNGRIYLAYGNYKVLLDWQNSQYFVSAVGFLADRIKYPPTE